MYSSLSLSRNAHLIEQEPKTNARLPLWNSLEALYACIEKRCRSETPTAAVTLFPVLYAVVAAYILSRMYIYTLISRE